MTPLLIAQWLGLAVLAAVAVAAFSWAVLYIVTTWFDVYCMAYSALYVARAVKEYGQNHPMERMKLYTLEGKLDDEWRT